MRESSTIPGDHHGSKLTQIGLFPKEQSNPIDRAGRNKQPALGV